MRRKHYKAESQAKAITRAEFLLQEGKVLYLGDENGQRLFCVNAQFNEGTAYDVKLHWQGQIASHQCTCPVYWDEGRECKHIVACKLYLLSGIR